MQFLTTRMSFRDTNRKADITLVRDIETHAGLLADARVDLIAFNCTAASLLAGPETIRARITPHPVRARGRLMRYLI